MTSVTAVFVRSVEGQTCQNLGVGNIELGVNIPQDFKLMKIALVLAFTHPPQFLSAF